MAAKPKVYLFVGFALYQVWKFLVLFSGTSEAHKLTYTVSLVCLALFSALLLRLFPRLTHDIFANRVFIMASTVLLCAAAVLTIHAADLDSAACDVLSGILSGAGTAAVDALWIRSLRNCSGRQFLLFSITVIVVEGMLSLGLLTVPLSIAAVSAVLFPIVIGTMLLLDAGSINADSDPIQKLPVFYFAAWMAFGLSIGLLSGLARTTEGETISASPWILAITLTIFAVFLFLNRDVIRDAIAVRDRRSLAIIFLLPILVVVFVSLPVVFNGSAKLQDASVAISFAIWELFLIYIVFAVANSLRQSAVRIYLFINVGRSVGLVAGMGVAFLLHLIGGMVEHVAMAVVVVACQVVLVMSFMATKKSSGEISSDVALPMDAASAKVAKRYMLTAREAEILALLAKGRTASRISEELFISPSTVTTHMNHIYQKCNVHSKQQLLDLCEEEL